MSLKQKVMSGLLWSAGAKFLGQLLTWGITIVIIRLLSPADYGLMELAAVFVAFLAMLSELGLGAAIIQAKDLDERGLRSLFGWVLLVSAGFYVSLAAAAPLIAGFYGEPRLLLLIRVLALQFLVMSFSVLPQSLLLREMAFRKIAVVDFASAIAGSITTLVLALNGLGVWALVWGSLMIRIVSTVGLNLARPFLCLPLLSVKGMGALFSFGGYVTLSRILWYFYISADTLIIGKVLGKELLGIYAVGMYLASLPMEKVSGLINQVAFPAFSSVQSEPGAAGRHFLKAVRVMSFLAFPILWGISSIAPELVAVFLGDKWLQSALPLEIIAMVVPLRMISTIMTPAALGAGRADVSFQNSLVAVILMPGAFLVGSYWGILGVSLAWVVVFPLVFCLNMSRVTKILEIRFINVLRAMLMPVMCGVIMYGCVQLLKNLPMMAIALVPKLILLVACGAGAYCFMTVLFNRRGLQEVRELVRV